MTLAAAAAVTLVGGLQQHASATTYSIINASNGNWSDGTKWSGGNAPTSNLDNIINFNTSQNTIMAQDISGLQLNTLITKNSGSKTLQITVGGGSLNFVKDSSFALPTWALSKGSTSSLTVAVPITVTDALTITNTGTDTTSSTVISGAITNTGGITFTGTGVNPILLGSGVISGAGGITQNGTYNLTMNGADTYAGLTAVNAGTLTLSGSITNASSALAMGGGTLNYTKAGTNTQTFNNGTAINSGYSTITNGVSTNTISLGALSHATGGILNITSVTGAGTTKTSSTVSNGILGTWATAASGTSLSYLAGGGGSAITAYTGTAVTDATGITSTAGTVNYDVAAGGATGAGASVNTLRYTGAADTITGDITTNGLMNSGTGAITYSGNVTIGSNSELVIVSNTQNITLSGIIANNGGTASSLTYGGPSAGTLTLSNANTYTGTTTIDQGTLKTSGSGTLGSTNNNLAVNGSAVLDLNGTSQGVGALSGSGTIDNVTTGTTNTLTLGNSNATGGNFSGVIRNTTGALSVTKTGSGTQILSGVSTYTGATLISSGVLSVGAAGTINSTSGVTINNGELNYTSSVALNKAITFTSGTLSGTGTLTAVAATNNNDTVAPGATSATGSYGLLSVSGNFSLKDAVSGGTSAGGKLAIGVSKATVGVPAAAGTEYDQVSVASTATSIDLTKGVLVLSVGSKVEVGDIYYILDNKTAAVAVTQTFGSASINGANATLGSATVNGIGGYQTFTSGIFDFAVSYNATTGSSFTGGNDVALYVVAAPEPASLSLLGLGAAGMLARRRRPAALNDSRSS